MNLKITGFNEMRMLAGTPFTQIISIHDAEAKEEGGYEQLVQSHFPQARVILAYFEDINRSSDGGPQEDEIKRLLAFSRSFTEEDRILIHCRAGVSRSTAIAFAVLCQHSAAGQESEALQLIQRLRPQLYPNLRIVEIADALLQREGRMVHDVEQFRKDFKLAFDM